MAGGLSGAAARVNDSAGAIAAAHRRLGSKDTASLRATGERRVRGTDGVAL
jgi:hypothetical protein